MNPGRLDKRITFGTFTSVENAYQDYVITFVPVLTTWSNIKPYDGNRQLQAQEQVINQVFKFTIRYRRDFAPTKDMRILYGLNYFTIHSIKNIDDRFRFFEILASVTDDNNGS
jgi:SPP1 family predicted phage head-tail adaptor